MKGSKYLQHGWNLGLYDSEISQTKTNTVWSHDVCEI